MMPTKAPWLCTRGWHAWRHLSMSDVRLMTIPGHSSHLCTLIEQCHRCGIARTTKAASVPKRWKVETRKKTP